MNKNHFIRIDEPDIKYTEIYKSSPGNTIPNVFDIKINGITYVFKNLEIIYRIEEFVEFLNNRYDKIMTLSKIDISGLVKVFNKVVMIKHKKQNEEYFFSVGYLMEKINGKNCNSLSDKESDLYNASKYSIYKRVYKILLRLFDKYKLCHNDLDKSNIMWDSESDKVSIIDIDFRNEVGDGSLYESEYFETNDSFINKTLVLLKNIKQIK